MLQRIQTVYLLFAAILSAATLFFSSLLVTVTVYAALFLMMVVVAIFLFKKRMLQVKICNWLMILIACFIISSVLYFYTGIRPLTLAAMGIARVILLVLPLISLILVALAKHGINKDEQKIRAIDRIR